jgi:hypothetical protein
MLGCVQASQLGGITVTRFCLVPREAGGQLWSCTDMALVNASFTACWSKHQGHLAYQLELEVGILWQLKAGLRRSAAESSQCNVLVLD